MNGDICRVPRSDGSGVVLPGDTPASTPDLRHIKFWHEMKTKNFELIELPINANQGVGRVPFPDISQLRNSALQGIETFNSANVSTSPNGLPPITPANAAATYISLYVNGKEQVVRMPLALLNRMYVNAGNYGAAKNGITEFDNLLGVDWSKSYILFAVAPVNTAFAIILGVHYS